jgi:hypothetical protein
MFCDEFSGKTRLAFSKETRLEGSGKYPRLGYPSGEVVRDYLRFFLAFFLATFLGGGGRAVMAIT